MNTTSSSAPGHITVEDLVALTDEMVSLTRAGVPLESGLAYAARDLARRPAKVATALSQRMQTGESLLHVLKTTPTVFPNPYVAVVEAGLRCGRLPAALEGLATSSRKSAELGRLTRGALVYPLFVALSAYALFVYGLIAFQPTVALAYEEFHRAQSGLNRFLVDFGRAAFAWLPWIPLVVMVLVALWWFRSARSTARQGTLASFGPIGQVLHLRRVATFADMLALLIENGVPLAPAITLSADASCDRHLQAACQDLAAELERGQNGSQMNGDRSARAKMGLPALLHWQITGGGSRNALAESLRTTSEAYRRRASRLEDWLRLYLPLGLLVGIGGTSVLLYAITMLGPWYEMLQQLANGRG